jgi:uncharacterized protein
MAQNENAINWFEIPVSDFSRAKKFYSAVFAKDVQEMAWNGMKLGFLPATEGAVTGAIIEGANYKPSQSGTLVYLNAGKNLEGALKRVSDAGGKVVLPKTDIGEYGYIARFVDTEGNLVALHTPK